MIIIQRQCRRYVRKAVSQLSRGNLVERFRDTNKNQKRWHTCLAHTLNGWGTDTRTRVLVLLHYE